MFEPVDNFTKLYIPLWWYGQVDKLDDHSPAHCDLTPGGDAKFGEHGYIFDGAGDHLIDDAGRKVIDDVTLGEWSSIYLTDGDVPAKGSVQGTGTKLYLNIAGTVPKITGKIVLYSRYCPGLYYFVCRNNSISVLGVGNLSSLTTLICQNNSMNQAMVDTVLCDMDGYGTSNGSINISGNAAPSAAGITCKNNLIARGWTVTTD